MREPESDAASSSSTAAGAGRAGWICVGLVAITVAVYAPVARHEFVTWDDDTHTYENAHVAAGLTWDSVRWAFTTGDTANWHPLTWLSHMLDVEMFGMDAGRHHVTSLVLHVVNTLLLFGVLRRMTGAAGRSAVVAALFAVHPLHVESVAWVAERKDVLSTTFWMLTLLAWTGHVRRPGRGHFLAALGLYALGLMAKPMLVTLPFVLLLLDRWPMGRMRTADGAAHPDALPLRRLVREKLPFFALSAASCAVTYLVQESGGAVGGGEAFPLGRRVVGALVSYVEYLGKTLWPARLAALYPHHAPSLSAWWAVGAALLLAAATLLAMRQARRRPWLIVGWLWFLGTLVPVIGLVQVGAQSMADRYTYVPLVGLFLAAVWGAHDLFARRPDLRFALAAAAAVAIAASAIVARRQVETWRTSFTLWQQALEVTTGNSVAHTNLGYALMRRGSIGEAIEHFEESLRIDPGSALTHDDLGLALLRQDRTDEAGARFAEAVRLAPGWAEAHSNLGLVLRAQNRVAEAVAHCREAVRLAPAYGPAHNNLGVALGDLGRYDEAVREVTEAVRIDPANAAWHFNLGLLLEASGDAARALEEFDATLRLDPSHAAAARAADAARRGNAQPGGRPR